MCQRTESDEMNAIGDGICAANTSQPTDRYLPVCVWTDLLEKGRPHKAQPFLRRCVLGSAVSLSLNGFVPLHLWQVLPMQRRSYMA